MTKFEKLAAHFRSEIQSGRLKPGDRLQSITQLREEFAVSYGTIRAAMLTLKSENLVIGRPGEGVFVADDGQ